MKTPFMYANRNHAGKVLAEILQKRSLDHPVLLALPRGGVPVAKVISETLKIDFDVLIVRKIGAPYNPEYGIGAISEDLKPLFNQAAMYEFEEMDQEIKETVDSEKNEVMRRIQLYRGSRQLPELKDKTVVLIDDGLATGVTAAAAARFLKSHGAKEVLLAVPVGPQRTSELVMKYVDEVICPYRPEGFSGVGSWYIEFSQLADHEVLSILGKGHEGENYV